MPPSSTATLRLRHDYLRLKRDPVPFVTAEPLPSNMLEWHYVVEGPPDSPYAGGFYHGKLVFPPEYPFRPPSILMITPSGRFKTNTRLCLSISDFHPDTWNPAWSVSTILTGLLSFMLEKVPTFGSITTSDVQKKDFALKSWQYNLSNKIFCELFPDIVMAIENKQKMKQEEECLASRLQEDAINSNTESSNGSAKSRDESPNHYTGPSVSLILNIAMVTGVALFAYLVRSIVKSLSDDNLS